jgi:hypothetical protein
VPRTVKEHFHSQEKAREQALEALRPSANGSPRTNWDTFIRLMQIILPVGALILGSITISWPFLNDTEVSFTLSKDDVARSDGVIRMTNMSYVGTDARDRLFKVQANAGEQDTPTAPRIRLTDIEAEMELEPGNGATVVARTGIYRTQENSLSLVGGVNLQTENGYHLEMDGAEIDLRARTAIGQGNVIGRSELGVLTAAEVNLNVQERGAVFDGGVSLKITPKRPAGNATQKGR